VNYLAQSGRYLVASLIRKPLMKSNLENMTVKNVSRLIHSSCLQALISTFFETLAEMLHPPGRVFERHAGGQKYFVSVFACENRSLPVAGRRI
jgi:hypothetical protein